VTLPARSGIPVDVTQGQRERHCWTRGGRHHQWKRGRPRERGSHRAPDVEPLSIPRQAHIASAGAWGAHRCGRLDAHHAGRHCQHMDGKGAGQSTSTAQRKPRRSRTCSKRVCICTYIHMFVSYFVALPFHASCARALLYECSVCWLLWLHPSACPCSCSRPWQYTMATNDGDAIRSEELEASESAHCALALALQKSNGQHDILQRPNLAPRPSSR
jgi:hypothetical protein